MSDTTHFFSTLSTLSILSLLSVTISNPIPSETPLLNIVPTPFSGKGSLIAIQKGVEIGCLSNSMKLRGVGNDCGIFYSSLEAGIPEYIPVTIMSSIQERCGFGYVPVLPPSFTPKYKIRCPPPANTQDDTFYVGRFPTAINDYEIADMWLQSVPGEGKNAGYRVMVVSFQRDYTIHDAKISFGADEGEVFTSEVGHSPQSFQIAWRSS